MNELTTFCRPTEDPTRFDVLYANGAQNQGLLHVTVGAGEPDAAVSAELAALHHLLVKKAIFGTDRAGRSHRAQSGDDDNAADQVRLKVTSGQIRKLMLQKSDKKHLVERAHFLVSRFAGARIETSKDASWVKPRAFQYEEDLVAEPILDDIMEVPGVGLATVSLHAIERIQCRGNGLTLAQAWHQLRRIVQGCDYVIEIAPETERYNLKRYGVVGLGLYSSQTQYNVVITPPKGSDRTLPVITTCYYEERAPKRLRRLQVHEALL